MELQYPTILGLSINQTSTLPEFARYLFAAGIAIAITVAAISIAAGGVFYLISFIRGRFADEGKDRVKAGALGLGIVLATYLIVYTINPDLVFFKLNGLKDIKDTSILYNNPNSSAFSIETYQEIPMGTLTENLLTKEIDCYSFGPNGSPIFREIISDDGKKIKEGPTFLEHDRADCLLQLADGAQKKAYQIARLSQELTKLSQQCNCEKYGDCQNTCNSQCDQPNPAECNPDYKCKGACAKDPENPKKETCNQTDPNKNCCPEGVKDKIEHGPIEIPSGNCVEAAALKQNLFNSSSFAAALAQVEKAPVLPEASQNFNFNGLDEFRCPNPKDNSTPCQNIPSWVEKQIQANKKTITIIDPEKWVKLNLSQQLTYFKEKISQLKNKFAQDQAEVEKARDTLNSCYLAIPYVDLLKNFEATNQKDKIILAQKIFQDKETQKPVDISKYCKGFAYGNSSCFKKCSDLCPDTSSPLLQAYQDCGQCANSNKDCLANKKNCLDKKYFDRPCLLAKDQKQTFKECLDGCKDDCQQSCSEKYSECSYEYKNCQKLCQDNSQCLYDNSQSCFIDPNLQDCAQKPDSGSIKNCIDNAYLCKNGSDQYSKYSDSRCPGCSCGQIDQTIKITVPDESNKENAGQEGETQANQDILEKKIASPKCNEYSFNDDPLTFYCQNNWWLDPNREGQGPKPVGAERKCEKNGQVPVGQAVDGSIEWSSFMQDSASTIIEGIEKMLGQMKKIGEAKNDGRPEKNYCKCNAKDQQGKVLCSTDCKYSQGFVDVPVFGQDGAQIGVNPELQCKCEFTPCSGNPCQQIIDYFSELWNFYRQEKINYTNFYLAFLKEPRSNVLKQLSYSRQKTNECSAVSNLYGDKEKMFSCTRVEDELMPDIIQDSAKAGPFSNYCYGQALGKLKNSVMTDDWFCCQQYKEN